MEDAVAWKQRIVKLVPRLLPVSRCCVYEVDEKLRATGHVNNDGDERWTVAYRDHFHRLDPCRPARFARSRATVVASEGMLSVSLKGQATRSAALG